MAGVPELARETEGTSVAVSMKASGAGCASEDERGVLVAAHTLDAILVDMNHYPLPTFQRLDELGIVERGGGDDSRDGRLPIVAMIIAAMWLLERETLVGIYGNLDHIVGRQHA